MTDERTKELFFELLERDAGGRAAHLAERCGDDARLRERLERLLAAHGRADDLLGPAEATPFGVPVALPAGPALAPGARLGPFRIVRVAGSGGFGTVYEAEQTHPVARRVALKILHRGLDSDEARARFDAERQALARMEHAGIARVYDAGTTPEGRPYFAMEFVEGLSITRHCEERGLGLRARLELFRAACQAVQHAHQKGIVHRDLKPSNVLVAEEPGGAAQPKVIDFGVAKAIDRPLTELSLRSVEGQLMGTPAYMSPEQAAGEVDVDTRADVYALGALLYELLCGTPPFDGRSLGFAALLRAIAEDDPPRPSARTSTGTGTSAGRVPFDLDWVTMRCLEKERGRRYPSASALAEDLSRFLAGLPVEAAPPSRLYRLRKLTRRHRLAFAAGLALLVALVAGAVGTSLGLVRANRARAALQGALARAVEAEERAADEAREATRQGDIARAVNLFLTDDLLSKAVPSTERGMGREVRLREVLDVTAERIEGAGKAGGRFAGMPEVEASIRSMMGNVYAQLGDAEEAVRHLSRAAELCTAALGAEHPRTLAAESELAVQLRKLGRVEESGELIRRVLESQRRVLGPEAEATLASELREVLQLHGEGRADEAYERARELLPRAEQALGPEHGTTLAVLNTLAMTAREKGHWEEAVEGFRELAARDEALHGRRHPETVGALTNLAAVLQAMGRYDEAVPLLEEALEVQLEVLGELHPDTLAALYNLGTAELGQSHFDRAEELLRRALAGNQELLGPDHAGTLMCTGTLGRCLADRGQREEAEALLRRAYEGTLAALGPAHPTTDSRRKDLASFLFRAPEHSQEVARLLTESLETQLESQGPDHPSTLRSMSNLALIHKRNDDLDEAERLLEQALAGFVRMGGEDHVESLAIASLLGGLYLDRGEHERALQRGLDVLARAERVLPPDHYDLNRYRLQAGIALNELGRTAEARERFERARESLLRTRGEDDVLTRYALQELAELEGEQ